MTETNRVLVVEDDPKLGGILVRALADDGIAADLADSGERALEMSALVAYRALVVDVILPRMDGLETCRRLRRGGLCAPVVVISAHDLDDDVRAAGGDDFLRKPFAMAILTDVIVHTPNHRPGDRWPAQWDLLPPPMPPPPRRSLRHPLRSSCTKSNG